eukprot:c1147_g1_i1.p1 GENE.c1147_g1_i1~~c1147_g1_i1.p1  ORF type:complete len:366 (+),score=44.38 c1147_g1_i1:269-1366(+)
MASCSASDQLSESAIDDGFMVSVDSDRPSAMAGAAGAAADADTSDLDQEHRGTLGGAGVRLPEMRMGNLRSQFEKFCQYMVLLEGPSDGFSNEYMHLAFIERNEPRVLVQITNHTRLKDRYQDIIPVEATNVSIGTPEEGRKGVSYINANYISLWTDTRYIATQGPLRNTVADFWRMIWMQKVSLIVMLTSLIERGTEKCHQYWPMFGESFDAGSLRVHYSDRARSPDYIIRTMVLTHVETGDSRAVTQAHFTSWPDQGVPLQTTAFAEYCDVVNRLSEASSRAPIVVHCSAGVGRSGVYIACQDILEHMRGYIAEGVHRMPFLFDIKATVKRMRAQRPFMVQNREQYIFVYQFIRAQVAQWAGL